MNQWLQHYINLEAEEEEERDVVDEKAKKPEEIAIVVDIIKHKFIFILSIYSFLHLWTFKMPIFLLNHFDILMN